MDSKSTDRLQRYAYDEYTVVVNFETFEDVLAYQQEFNGELVEVGFLDGSDNPMPDDSAQLLANKRTFSVSLPPEYSVIYSDDERFQEYSQEALVALKKLDNDMAPEDILADQNIATGDRIIILKDGELNTVSTRERIKYLMRGNVYELAVKVQNT